MKNRNLKVFSDPSTIICILTMLFFAQNGESEELNCGGSAFITIVAPNNTINRSVCDASDKAIHFLGQYGLHPKHPITIHLVDKTIDHNGYIAFGSYDRQSGIIQLMSYAAIMRTNQSPQMYDQPFDREHYQGAIAHEVAHAIFHHNSRNVEKQLTNASQEYLAHSTQLGTLSPKRRQQIISSSDVGSWESGDSISEIYMGLNPTGFAVKSYLHLTGLADPQRFIKILLNHNWFYVSVP